MRTAIALAVGLLLFALPVHGTAQDGSEPAASTPQEMRDRVAREAQLWTKTVDDAGIPKQ